MNLETIPVGLIFGIKLFKNSLLQDYSKIFKNQEYSSFLPLSRYSLSNLGMFVNDNTEPGYNSLFFIISRITDDFH